MRLNKSTGLLIAGIGAAVAGLGSMIGGRFGSMIKGFGAAHIALGILDNFRSMVKKKID